MGNLKGLEDLGGNHGGIENSEWVLRELGGSERGSEGNLGGELQVLRRTLRCSRPDKKGLGVVLRDWELRWARRFWECSEKEWGGEECS